MEELRKGLVWFCLVGGTDHRGQHSLGVNLIILGFLNFFSLEIELKRDEMAAGQEHSPGPQTLSL